MLKSFHVLCSVLVVFCYCVILIEYVCVFISSVQHMVLSCGNIHELYTLLSFCSFPTGHFHLLHSSSLPLYSWPRLLWENVSHSWADLGSALPSRLLWGAETLMSLTDTALTWQEPLSLGCSEPDWPLWTPIIYCIRVIIRWKQSRWLRDLGSAESHEILYNRCRLHWWSIMAQYGQLSCEILGQIVSDSERMMFRLHFWQPWSYTRLDHLWKIQHLKSEGCQQ